MRRRAFIRAAALAWLPLVQAAEPPRLLVFGDSITCGLGASVSARAYAPQVAAWLGRTLDNRATSGSFCAHHVETIRATSFEVSDLVLWLTGYNDMRGGTPIEEYAKVLRQGLETISVPIWLGNCLRMTAAGYRDMPGGHGSDARVAEFNRVIAAVAATFPHVRLVDACAAYDPQHNADLVHPNDTGHVQIARAFARPLFVPIWRQA